MIIDVTKARSGRIGSRDLAGSVFVRDEIVRGDGGWSAEEDIIVISKYLEGDQSTGTPWDEHVQIPCSPWAW